MYKRLIYYFGDTIEVEDKYPMNYGAPGQKRLKKKKATPEQIKKQNKRNRENRIRRIMKENFRENDIWLTLTYKQEERPPDMDQAKKDVKRFFDRMRPIYKREGIEFKWMLHTEKGSRGGIHHHIILNQIPDIEYIIRQKWTLGGVHPVRMYKEGGFRDLADYMAKEPEGKNGIKESRFSRSRNLKAPEPEVKMLNRWQKEPKPLKGYFIEKESYHEGINPVTGRKYRGYTMIRLNRRI